MRRRAVVCVLALVAGCGGGEQPAKRATPPAEGRIAADLPQKLDAMLAKRAGEAGVPGAAAALVVKGELVWSGGWGEADLAAGRPMSSRTPVAYASVGKIVTAALALRLAEQGRLSLDDPVRRWVPRWPGAPDKTLRDLLGHRGGLRDAPDAFYARQIEQPAHRFAPADWLAALSQDRRDPAGVPSYNNAGYVVAGVALRRAAGKDWPALLRDTAPGIALQPDQHVAGRPARGYWYPGDATPRPFGDGRRLVPSTSLATASWTAGGYAGSVESLARWADGLFSGKVLEPESLREMTAFRESGLMGDAYGLGLAHFQSNGHEAWGHIGSITGFHSDLTHLPQEGVTLVSVWNDDLIADDAIPYNLMRVALDGIT